MAQSAAPIGDSLVIGLDWSVDFSQREVQRFWYQSMAGALTVYCLVLAEPIYSWTLHRAVGNVSGVWFLLALSRRGVLCL